MAKDAKYWVSRFGIFDDDDDDSERAEEMLVRMGARAVPALVAGLKSRNHGWQAAMVLGQIGLPAAKEAIPQLVAVVRKGTASNTDLWSARALGQMGQRETLMEMASSKKSLPAVVAGLKEARPDSYANFESLLARKDKRLAKMIAEELDPGSAYYDPPANRFELVAAATRSEHAVLRKDAAFALAALRGVKAKKRMVEVLVPMLADKDAEVRRLAVLSLGRCKSAARPALPAIKLLLKDRAAKVRQFAQRALDEIGAKS